MSKDVEIEKSMPIIRRPFINVAAFIDWNSQLLLTRISQEENPVLAARTAFTQVTRRIAHCLALASEQSNFRVSLRLYHGWRKGYEPTVNFKSIKSVISETDFSSLSERSNVAYSDVVGYGDCLMYALPKRLHSNISIHLPNTLRDRGNQRYEEKMVDTAMAVDTVVYAYQDPKDWIVVVGEDDDLIPPLFTAEAVVGTRGGRVLLISKRDRGKNFLLLEGLDIR